MNITKATINKAIKHTGLTVHGERGAGNFYFRNDNGPVGEAVCVCYLNQMTIAQWVKSAESAAQAE